MNPIVYKEPRVFISYAREDKKKVKKIYGMLQRAGLKPWMDILDINGGRKWRKMLQDEIQSSVIFIYILSQASVQRRGVCQRELKWAVDVAEEKMTEDIFIMPVIIDDIVMSEIPYELREYQIVDLREKDGMIKLIRDLKKGLYESGVTLPFIIRSPVDRTKYIINDLDALRVCPPSRIKKMTVWYSGFLSSFAVNNDDVSLKGESGNLLEHVMNEKRALVKLAEKGCRIKCMVAPPTKDSLIEERRNIAIQRLKALLDFMNGNDKLLKGRKNALNNIYWAVSPLRQKNIYIIGDISCYEGFKEDIQNSYSLTLWRIGRRVVKYEAELYQVLFDLLAKYTLRNFGESSYIENEYEGMGSKKKCKLLRSSAINAIGRAIAELSE